MPVRLATAVRTIVRLSSSGSGLLKAPPCQLPPWCRHARHDPAQQVRGRLGTPSLAAAHLVRHETYTARVVLHVTCHIFLRCCHLRLALMGPDDVAAARPPIPTAAAAPPAPACPPPNSQTMRLPTPKQIIEAAVRGAAIRWRHGEGPVHDTRQQTTHRQSLRAGFEPISRELGATLL